MLLSEMRDAVYAQTDLDSDDLPTSLVDLYLQEAFQRTVQMEQRWPSYEQDWAVTTDAATPARVAYPTDLAGLVEVLDGDGYPLSHISHSAARASFENETGDARWFSVWGGQMWFWPKPTEVATYQVRGWRLPTAFALNGNASEVPDCDTRLHLTLIHYAVSRVYAQQEDEILERTYLDSWSRGVEMARADVMRPMLTEPLVLNQGFMVSSQPMANRFTWNI